MSGDITRRQALTLGAIGAGAVAVGAAGAGVSAPLSAPPAPRPDPNGIGDAGGPGWSEPTVVTSSAGGSTWT